MNYNDVLKPRPLILGTAVKYNWKELSPFINSCKKYIPDAKIVLFVSDIDIHTIEKLQLENVEIIIDTFIIG